jgi:hypothetical protein
VNLEISQPITQSILSPYKQCRVFEAGLNFALQDGTTLLILLIQEQSVYNEWKKQQGFFTLQYPIFEIRPLSRLVWVHVTP